MSVDHWVTYVGRDALVMDKVTNPLESWVKSAPDSLEGFEIKMADFHQDLD